MIILSLRFQDCLSPEKKPKRLRVLHLIHRKNSRSIFSASRASTLSADLAKYQIIHFATHSFINNKHPELSGIVLSLIDENGQAQDKIFSARMKFLISNFLPNWLF